MATVDDIARHEEIPLESRYDLQSTYQVLEEGVERWPDNTAVSFQLKGKPTDKIHDWTYRELYETATRAANLFRSLGATEKNSVALILPNLPETLAALFAAQTSGIVNPINPLLEPAQIASILRDADAKIVVTLKAFPKTEIPQNVAEALKEVPGVDTVIEIDMRKYLSPPLSWLIPLIRPKIKIDHGKKVLQWDEALAGQSGDKLTFDIPEGGQERVAAYFHTGGTTGDPKLATHKIGGMLFIGHVVKEGVLNEGDVILCALPLFHCFGAYVMGLTSPMNGGRLVLMTPAGFRGEAVMENFWKLVERYKVNFFMSVPTALAALNQKPVNADVSSLTYTVCGSAPLPVELFKQFEAKTGIKILEGYGQTEATVVCSVNPPEGERKIGSVGFPLPYTRMKLLKIDDDGVLEGEAEKGEIGEICIRGPHVFPGYKDIDRSKIFIADEAGAEWLRSGDLGREDEDGYFWITGRAKDLIIRGGHNIDPGMVEEALTTHPKVALSAVIGQPDSYAGELPCAYVELNEGESVTQEELLEYGRQHVSERAARPVYVEVLDELPKTHVGKIFKPDLRRMAIRRVYTDALRQKGINAEVRCIKDKKAGQIAIIKPKAGATEDQIAEVLNGFAGAWKIEET
jgi:acyl-CoA synthetase (AMP-forming)/AMP-acid ligase II